MVQLTGLNALLSIVLNLVILMGLVAYIPVTMTLPGIAGLILTIGIGVDSNVLIFERIKEELAAGRAARAAVYAGFDRAWITIVDTHVASLIAAACLFQFGTSPIRGFATTLTIGLLANVLTAVFVFEDALRPDPLAPSHGDADAEHLAHATLDEREFRLQSVAAPQAAGLPDFEIVSRELVSAVTHR